DSFYDDPEAFGREPVGNGPYEFASWTNNEEITVDKWEDFPGEEPGQVDSIQWRMYDDQDTAYQDLISGNLDIMARLTPAALAGDVYHAYLEHRYIAQDSGFTFPATITPEAEGYDTPKFRQALSLAIDRDEMAQPIFNGAQEAADGWATGIVVGHQEDACSGYCDFDPDRANELLRSEEHTSELQSRFDLVCR